MSLSSLSIFIFSNLHRNFVTFALDIAFQWFVKVHQYLLSALNGIFNCFYSRW